MTLHQNTENLKRRAGLYHYLACTREQMEEVVNFLEALETIMNRAKEAEDMYPYRIPGQRETYDHYNEGWQDCLEFLGINELIEGEQE